MAAITDLSTLTSLSSSDYLVVHDVTDATDKKTTLSDLGMAGGVMTKMLVLSAQSATIATGAITASASHITLAGEGGAADALDTINGGVDGAIVILHTTGASTITVKHATGNLRLAGGTDFAMNVRRDNIMLMYSSLQPGWLEVSRSDVT